MKGQRKGRGWRNESQRHRLAGMGISTTNKKSGEITMKARGMEDDIFDQIKKGKFPLRIRVDSNIIKEHDNLIKEIAEGDEEYERHIRKKASLIKISLSEFKDMTGIEDEFASMKEDARDSYHWYKDEAREDGWLDEVPPFKEWFIDEYGHAPNIKEYMANLEEDEIMVMAEDLKDAIKDDYWDMVEF